MSCCYDFRSEEISLSACFSALRGEFLTALIPFGSVLQHVRFPPEAERARLQSCAFMMFST
jgi:hypothetical protein